MLGPVKQDPTSALPLPTDTPRPTGHVNRTWISHLKWSHTWCVGTKVLTEVFFSHKIPFILNLYDVWQKKRTPLSVPGTLINYSPKNDSSPVLKVLNHCTTYTPLPPCILPSVLPLLHLGDWVIFSSPRPKHPLLLLKPRLDHETPWVLNPEPSSQTWAHPLWI